MQTAQTFAAAIIDSPAYQRTILERARTGTLDPQVEEILWSIGHSAIKRRPVDRDLRHTIAELVRRLAIALRGGDVEGARLIWDEGKLAVEIEHLLR